MPEINSRQAAQIAANTKVLPSAHYGKQRTVVITTPATHAIANGDTLGSGLVLPTGTRFLATSALSNAAMGAGATVSIGIRNPRTKVAIFATAIANAVAVATAQQVLANNGTQVAAGIEYITDQPVEVYLTFGGATPTANAQLRAEVAILTND